MTPALDNIPWWIMVAGVVAAVAMIRRVIEPGAWRVTESSQTVQRCLWFTWTVKVHERRTRTRPLTTPGSVIQRRRPARRNGHRPGEPKRPACLIEGQVMNPKKAVKHSSVGAVHQTNRGICSG